MIMPTGTGRLIRLILRRDRWLLPLWIVLPPLILMAFASALAKGFPSEGARQQYANTSGANAMFIMMYGELHGQTLADLVAWRAGFLPVIIALCSLLTVIRHTRAEEESGRSELIAATAISRYANLAAAVTVTCAASLLLAVATALGLTAWGLPPVGSIALGSGLAIAGCVFAAFGAVAAQLTSSAAIARGMGIVVLGGTFLLRSVGDISGQAGGPLGWVAWLSPVGWGNRLRPFAGERWWVLAAAAAVFASATTLAIVLSARRDLGAGLLAANNGPATAAPGLRTPVALAWRLHRGSLAGWTAGAALAGFALGGVGSAGEQISTTMSAQTRAVMDGLLNGAGSLSDQFIAVVLEMFSMVAAGFAVLTVLVLLAEERSGRAETLLATPVSRVRWAASHLLFAVLSPVVVTVIFGAAMGLVHGLNSGDLREQFFRVLGAALVRLPAIWWFAGLALTLFGCRPKLTSGAFLVLGASLLILGLGIQLHLSHWIVDLSPFSHMPELPGGVLRLSPLVMLVGFSALLAVVGLFGLRRRDLPGV